MSLIDHLNTVASALHHHAAAVLQREFSLSRSPTLLSLVFDTSLEKGAADIRRAIAPLDANWAEALSQRWRAAVALWREGDVTQACLYMGNCVSYVLQHNFKLTQGYDPRIRHMGGMDVTCNVYCISRLAVSGDTGG